MARSMHVPGSSFPLFGSRLRSARARAQLTVAACAQRCGVSPEQWARWERGGEVPYAERDLATIAALVGADPDWLLGLMAPYRAWPPQAGGA